MSLEIQSLVQAIEQQTKALKEQTKTIDNLVESNQELIALMASILDEMASEGVMDDDSSPVYLNGLSAR